MSVIADKVFALSRPVVEAQGCSLWDVEYVREGGRRVLRLYIDREGGVSTEHCEAVSRALDPLLDEVDPIPDAYVLEVSSCGLERPLKRPSDFQAFMGAKIVVKLYAPRDGRREFAGVLTGYDPDTRVITLDGQTTFAPAEVALAHLQFEWK